LSTVCLETSRLYLRPLTKSDVNFRYVAWLNDKQVNKYLESRLSRYSMEDLIEYIGAVNKKKTAIMFGLFIKETGKHIGNIKIDDINLYHLNATIGILLGEKSEWGKGYASEAITAVTKFCFSQLELKKICAGCYESNLGSKKAFEKVGYKVEGFLRGQVDTDCGREGVWQLGIIPSDVLLSDDEVV